MKSRYRNKNFLYVKIILFNKEKPMTKKKFEFSFGKTLILKWDENQYDGENNHERKFEI